MSADELHDLIRQLRVELEWAVRTGIAPPPPPKPPPIESARRDERAETRPPEAPSARPRQADDARTPRPSDEGRPSAPPSSEPSYTELDPPPIGMPARPPQEAAPERGPGPPPSRRAAHPSRPWEAYLPESGPRPSDRRAPPPERSPTPEAPPASSARAPMPEAPAEPASAAPPMALPAAASLEQVREVLGPCVRCKLHQLGRKKIVFGVGPDDAEIMFVGEGPGADEDRVGEPFVGKAGQLLTRIIESGMGVRRAEVYIANIVKCRPPRNRNPEPDEVEQCEPFLRAQIRVIQPKVIVALGKYAAQTLLRDQTPITRLRGKWREYEGIPLMPTFHPAYLLRNPAEKRPVWQDIQEVLKFLGRPVPNRG